MAQQNTLQRFGNGYKLGIKMGNKCIAFKDLRRVSLIGGYTYVQDLKCSKHYVAFW